MKYQYLTQLGNTIKRYDTKQHAINDLKLEYIPLEKLQTAITCNSIYKVPTTIDYEKLKPFNQYQCFMYLDTTIHNLRHPPEPKCKIKSNHIWREIFNRNTPQGTYLHTRCIFCNLNKIIDPTITCNCNHVYPRLTYQEYNKKPRYQTKSYYVFLDTEQQIIMHKATTYTQICNYLETLTRSNVNDEDCSIQEFTVYQIPNTIKLNIYDNIQDLDKETYNTILESKQIIHTAINGLNPPCTQQNYTHKWNHLKTEHLDEITTEITYTCNDCLWHKLVVLNLEHSNEQYDHTYNLTKYIDESTINDY